MRSFAVRPMEEGDLGGVEALQRTCFPPPFPENLLWTAGHLSDHLRLFPEGQWVATAADGVAGSASSLLVSEARWNVHQSWDETTGGHGFAAHDPQGTTLYGADISVHPAWRGIGVGRALYEARFELVRANGLRRFGTACRLPDYAAWRSRTGDDVEAYAGAVARGLEQDRTMTPLLRFGLRYVGIIRDYMEDEESADAAAMLEWTP